jgi:hypothetical protein
MRHIFTAFLLLGIAACSYGLGGGEPISPGQRLLIVCEGWNSIFSKINDRDDFGIATDAEVQAINTALPILNPVCTSDFTAASGVDLGTLEAALLAVILAERGEAR